MTRASVLIPIHNKPDTLPLAVGSVLGQTEPDLEVILIGDGVTPEVRDAVEGLLRLDRRVRFLDRPKGASHGEQYRHEAILAARSDAIFYLCDDDLFLPRHVADLLGLLEGADLVQCANSQFAIDGTLTLHVGNLGDPRDVRRIVGRGHWSNFVSLTGTAHTRAFYLQVADHWRVRPGDDPPDYAQWRPMLAHPALRGATSPRITALQFPSHSGRDLLDGAQRRRELADWAEVIAAPGGQAVVDDLHRDALQRSLWAANTDLQEARPALQRYLRRPTRRLLDAARTGGPPPVRGALSALAHWRRDRLEARWRRDRARTAP